MIESKLIYLPPLRRFLLPSILLLAIIVFYRSSLQVPTSLPSFVLHPAATPPEGIHVPIANLHSKPIPYANTSDNHLSPPSQYYYSYETGKQATNQSRASGSSRAGHNANFEALFQCSLRPNRYTGHVRLQHIIQNISHIPPNSTFPESRVFWNPTIVSLPSWSKNQYLVVSRIVTEGRHQENVLCEANVCYTGSGEGKRAGEVLCTREDLLHVGPAGGMRCVASPITLSVPPTPAEKCEGKFGPYVDIPGFHDPRIFWSGKGEPLMMVNTQ